MKHSNVALRSSEMFERLGVARSSVVGPLNRLRFGGNWREVKGQPSVMRAMLDCRYELCFIRHTLMVMKWLG